MNNVSGDVSSDLCLMCVGLLVKLARCFSVVRNIEMLSMRSVKSLPCLDGVRVVSFALLMFGQTTLAMYQSGVLGQNLHIVFWVFYRCGFLGVIMGFFCM